MKTRLQAILGISAVLWIGADIPAAELHVYPPTVDLAGPQAVQRLLVLDTDNHQFTIDATNKVKFSSANHSIATVSPEGIVRAVGDGDTVISADVNGRNVSVPVKVRRTKAPAAVNFRNHVIPLLTKVGCNSGACHGALAGKGGLRLSLRGYDPDGDHFVLTQQVLGRRIDRPEPEQSLVLLKPTRQLQHGGGKKFETDSEEYHRLLTWISSGAIGPSKSDPTLERIEVFPPSAKLKLKDSLRTIVRAWYSDGRAEDVTPWARFTSSEEPVATVDEGGKITIVGPGEAAINVAFGHLVSSMLVTVPHVSSVDAKLFAQSPRQNFIDELVLRELQSLNIPPSVQCTDREFIRRAFLDCIGALPTPDEVERFVSSTEPDKRGKLIDRLLARPEFVDYWSYKWSEMFLVSSKKLSTPAMWAFYRSIRQAVSENTPWDRFAREMLTARGSSLDNGAANFLVLHKDPADLAESTSLTFMGLSVACARCHNHPLEKWTQDQYWSFANLFGRVGMKNGDRGGDVIIFNAPTGDVPHQRRGVPMPPAPLDAPALALDSTQDRRQYFADWLTKPENPYFAKALVNRVWRNFLGRGLVEAEDDLRQTNPPSNPELFNALAQDFVKHGYDVKHLIRLIVASGAYQRSSHTLPGNQADDRYYSHYLVRRLPAEVLLDAYSQVTGIPTVFDTVYIAGRVPTKIVDSYPPGTRAQQLPDSQIVLRFLDAFGRAERMQTCSCERQSDTSTEQALTLNNGQVLNDKLRAKDSIIAKWLLENITDDQAIPLAFSLCLNRAPTAAEAERLRKLLGEQREGPNARREGLEDLFWALLTTREFLFNH